MGRIWSPFGSAQHRTGMEGAREKERLSLLTWNLWKLLDSAPTGIYPQLTFRPLFMLFGLPGMPALLSLPLSKANPESLP